ncbi:unnamed protein product [Acanthoscelides obtectus]|uniref:Uncharacterized protein n=1 Tax=Acanthoscelides obtectus TaxID=200917 RepID=A0A9P0PKC8_ACAOB|nr:unnamed protein product [Acanthoscelides obtectus]CAK1662472.1 hypothetical protein AOBTE_LOCUS23157 [Acanthoscelides obtectus]
MVYTEAHMTSMRGELEIVQKALKLQTKRCRQLVAEYTRRLQEKEVQYQSEKALRDDQLAKVLRALLIFEARLKQEQKYISHQLNEKDYIIKKQSNDIKKLLSNQYCKNCNQYYTSSPIQESLESSSEYVVTDYQSSNFESLDSSSETYALMSEKDYNKSECSYQTYNDDISKSETESVKSLYQKNRNKDSLGRRSRKIPHRKSIGTYFEVLKLRNDNNSPMSNEDNTSNDYEHLDSLPPESLTDKISEISGNIESIFEKNQHLTAGTESSTNISTSECNNTVINKYFSDQSSEPTKLDNQEPSETKERKLSDTIPVFEADEETNDNWYASASDQEDEEHRDIYRNNPVLECMNQILLQNINDPLNSPPKTPNIERKSMKNKRVKFSDEEQDTKPEGCSDLKEENLKKRDDGSNHDYYETPVQKTPNFYETPQSIYSNDYEQILSRRSEISTGSPPNGGLKPRKVETPSSHYYIDMDSRSDEGDNKLARKLKISRTPPALPPKPANLTSKYKIQNSTTKAPSEKSDESVLEFEPDYCSISELNLPQQKNVSFQKISVVAEINAPSSLDVLNKLKPPGDSKTEVEGKPTKSEIESKLETPKTSPAIENNRNSGSLNEKLDNLNKKESKIDTLSKLSTHNDNKDDFLNKMNPLNDPKMLALSKIKFPNEKNIDILSKLNTNKENKIKEKIADFNQINESLIVKKCVEKLNIQLAKQTPIKSEVNLNTSKRNEPEIPKLPQVSEIIIPDENEEKKEERITQDNYVKNNSQIFKLSKTGRNDIPRRPIVIGSSVSSLISEFNNQQILSELKKKPDRKVNQHMFSSFDKSQNYDKQASVKDNTLDSSKFESFDLSQNFEEFKLDECDIEEYKVDEDLRSESSGKSIEKPTDVITSTPRVEIVRATNDALTPQLSRNSIEMLRKQLEQQKSQIHSEQPKENTGFKGTEPTYEHFLECTGLSSKSILTPSRLLSNHKSMLKPKDVKLRSKVRNSNGIIFDRHANPSVKYWSEPYV